jgi:hypothetical protein
MFQHNINDETISEETRQWLKSEPSDKVFEWLGNDTNNIPNYLHLLNLMWSQKGVNHDLQLYQKVAQRLGDEPKYLSQMIRTNFWRHTLIACVSVILLQARAYCTDLKASFEQRNFVSPQIAVALGLVCPTEAVSYLSSVVRQANCIPDADSYQADSTIHTDPKRIVAAHLVLSKLDMELAEQLAQSEVFKQHQNHMNGEIGSSVADLHWKFWSEIINTHP